MRWKRAAGVGLWMRTRVGALQYMAPEARPVRGMSIDDDDTHARTNRVGRITDDRLFV